MCGRTVLPGQRFRARAVGLLGSNGVRAADERQVPGKGPNSVRPEIPPQTAYVGLVRLPVVLPELEHFLEWDRRQIQRHRLQIQLDTLSQDGIGSLNNALSTSAQHSAQNRPLQLV